ncbi:MAG: YdcF family protein [Eubacterium sp.]|nr:YdcF family protein [Eubacterium sp.]
MELKKYKEQYFSDVAELPRGLKILGTVLFFVGVLSVLLMVPAIMSGVINIGGAIGVLGGGMFIAAAVLLPLYRKRFGKALRILYRVYLAVLAAMTAFAVFLSVMMMTAIFGAPPEPDSTRTVIVLGCQVYDSGPSVMLKNRLNAAYDYLTANPDASCVVSGGKGDTEPVSEASAMKEYLISRGIEESRIYIEDRSTNTLENLTYSKQVIAENGLDERAVIVTDGFHLKRAQMFAQKVGLDVRTISAHTPLFLLPTYWCREWASICYYAIFPPN